MTKQLHFHFSIPHSSVDRSSRYKTNKETKVLNDKLYQIDLIGIYKTFHPKAAEYTFFSSAHGIFSSTNDILGHKLSLNTFKKTEIMSSIILDHNATRLEINYRRKPVRN